MTREGGGEHRIFTALQVVDYLSRLLRSCAKKPISSCIGEFSKGMFVDSEEGRQASTDGRSVAGGSDSGGGASGNHNGLMERLKKSMARLGKNRPTRQQLMQSATMVRLCQEVKWGG